MWIKKLSSCCCFLKYSNVFSQWRAVHEKSVLMILTFLWSLAPCNENIILFWWFVLEPFNNYIYTVFELIPMFILLPAIPATSWGNVPSISVLNSSLLNTWPHTDHAEVLSFPVIQMVPNQHPCCAIYLELLWMFLVDLISR